MSLLKILFIIFLTYLILQFINFMSRIIMLMKTVKVASNQHFKQQADYSNNNPDSNTMVKCAKCQLYIPGADAIVYRGNPYCCKEHIAN